jgi:hypothetical protein
MAIFVNLFDVARVNALDDARRRASQLQAILQIVFPEPDSGTRLSPVGAQYSNGSDAELALTVERLHAAQRPR